MSGKQTTETESQITTDRKMIRGWADEHDAIPVRYAGTEGGSGRLGIVPESKRDDRHEELTWDAFFEEFEQSNYVVVYHGDDRSHPFEVISRDEAIGRTTVENDVVENALMEGETVTSEVAETRVIERTIVEEATVESKITDREPIEEEIVDAELLTREAVECELLDGTGHRGEPLDVSRFETGHRGDESLRVEIAADEVWSITKEVLEQLTIESRVVDAAVTETDTVEADSVEATVDVEGVQRTILDSNLVDAEATPDEVVAGGMVESDFVEGDVVETRLTEHKTVEEEVTLRRHLTGEIDEGETLEAETIRRDVIESGIVDREVADLEAETSGRGSEATTGTEAGGGKEMHVMPSDDDEGKTVVDTAGEEIGMIVEVEGRTVYVDPHPSLADRIKVALDWGEMDEDVYSVEADRIARITDDRVELSIEK